MKFASWIIFPLRQGLSLQTVWPEMYYIIQAILKVAAKARMTGTRHHGWLPHEICRNSPQRYCVASRSGMLANVLCRHEEQN